MSRITLPAGTSLQEIAARLGVSVDALQKHAGLQDAEAPVKVDHHFDVPDGFLRERRKVAPKTPSELPRETGQKKGMNMWMAMDIEQKRTRAQGGLQQEPTDNERLAFEEARRTFMRFEAASNNLAIDLFGQLSASMSAEVRGLAFAWQGWAYANRYLLFGEPAGRARAQGLSSAKAAQWADPKLPEGHLAMALSLRVEATPEDAKTSWRELEHGLHLQQDHPWLCAEAARAALRSGDPELALELLGRAKNPCLMICEVRGLVAMHQAQFDDAGSALAQAIAEAPSYANAAMLQALCSAMRDPDAPSDALRDQAIAAATTAAHRDFIRAVKTPLDLSRP